MNGYNVLVMSQLSTDDCLSIYTATSVLLHGNGHFPGQPE